MRPVLILTAMMLWVSPRVEANPPPIAPIAKPTKPKLSQRLLQPVRNFSLKTANRCRNLYERIPPGVRYTGMTVLTSAATTYSATQLANHDLGSVGGVLSLTGVVLGFSGAMHQGQRALRTAFPGRMKSARQRLEASPLVGPWLKDSRPWLQRIKSRFRKRAQGEQK